MASRDIEALTLPMATKAHATVDLCRQRGVDLLIYCTLRSLHEQAVLYRQSRTFAQIERKAVELSTLGFGFLAEILMKVGPQYGPHVTNAGPGESWHNYREAFDAVPLVGGKPVWSYRQHRKLWDTYGECAEQVGLSWAGRWTRFREYPHCQLRSAGNPLRLYRPAQVQYMLKSAGLL